MSDIADMMDVMAKALVLPHVYPGYLASIIKKSVLGADKEAVFRSVGPIERIGDAKDTLTITDFNGTAYRITVEVIQP